MNSSGAINGVSLVGGGGSGYTSAPLIYAAPTLSLSYLGASDTTNSLAAGGYNVQIQTGGFTAGDLGSFNSSGDLVDSKVAITAPATSATLTIANGKTLTANNSLTLAGTDSTTITFPNTSISVIGAVDGDGTVLSSAACTPSAAGVCALSLANSPTGTGSVVLATSPTLVTPTLGVATATTVNKVTITAPSSSATLTIGNGKTLTASNSLTLAGTDSTTMTFPNASSHLLASVSGDGTVLSSTACTPTSAGGCSLALVSNAPAESVFSNNSSSTGTPGFNTSLNLSSTGVFSWNSDTGISRGSTGGIIDFGTGAQGSTAGSLDAANLTVSSTVRANGSFNAAGTAGVTAGSFTSITSIASTEGIITTLTGSSDVQLKTNIEPFTRSLTEIMQLHPSTYEWNRTGRIVTKFPLGFRQAGFVAQDVQAAIPEAVGSERDCIRWSEGDNPRCQEAHDYLTLSDRPIIAALVNAVQEQQREIEDLKAQVAESCRLR